MRTGSFMKDASRKGNQLHGNWMLQDICFGGGESAS